MARPGLAQASLAVTLAVAGWLSVASEGRCQVVSARGRLLDVTGNGNTGEKRLGPCAMTLTEVNLSQITYAGQCLGLDVVTYASAPAVSFTSAINAKVFFADPDSGAELGSFDLHGANTGPFGNHEWDGMYFNDWNVWYRYFTDTEGIGWTIYDNPAHDAGRGMDADRANGLVWETSSSTGLYAFGPTDSIGTFFDISASVQGQMSGLAVYPHDANTGIAVAFYETPQVLFFEFTGTTVDYVTCADLPQTFAIDESWGLAYSESRGTFFWSYVSVSGHRYLSELRPSGPGIDLIFGDGFESGDTSAWSDVVP